MAWWLTASNAYANSTDVSTVYVTGSDTTWHLNVSLGSGLGDDILLNGTWASQAAAMEAARQLVQGFDAADLG